MTNLIKNKKFTRIMAILLVVLIAFSTMFTLPVSAASGDKVTITFDYCYDSTGNTIKFQQTTVSDGYTVGTPGEELCKIFADGKEAYCIEPGHSLFSGNSLTENGSTVWKNLGTAKQKAINLALLYGKPGSGKNLSGTEDQKWIATQLIVWEFVSGCRSTNDGYKCTNTKYIDGICAGGANPGVKSVYNAISKSLANYSTVPSFASAIASKAETYEMKYSDGKYSVTLTDSNKILDEFTFKTTNGITATKSGNKLTLTSTSAVNDALTFNSAKSMPDVGKTVLVPYGDASLQDVITGVENDADPIRAYLKVKTSSGNLKLVKTSEDGNVANIEFIVKGENFNKTVKTNSKGEFKLTDLVPGTYTVTENTEGKYAKQNSKTVKVESGKTATVSFANILKKWSLTVTKTDAETKTAQGNATLAGAVYGIYNNGKLVDKYTTDKNGSFTTSYYVCGDNWILKEIEPSEGYLLDETEYHIGAEAKNYTVENNSISMSVTEDITKGKISIIKHTDDGSTKIETPEKGAEFQVYLKSSGSYSKAKETERDTLLCDEYGFAETKDLPYGTYTVHQTKGWDGTEFIKDFDVFINENGVTIVKTEKKNTPQKGTITVEKTGEIFSNVTAIGGGYTDENGNDIALPTIYQPEYSVSGLSGAVFEIYADEDITTPDGTVRVKKDTLVATLKTNEKGTATSNELYLGKYRVVETVAPNGTVLNKTVNHIELTYAGQNEKVTNTSTSFVNERQKVEIDLLKILEQDETFGIGNGNEIKSVSFGLYADEDIKASNGTVIPKDGLVEIITCDENGKATFATDLPFGGYYVKEIKTDIHYILSDEKYPVVFEYVGQNIATVNITVNNGEPIRNELAYGTIKGLKIDRETGENISGALFGLFSTDETEFTEENSILTAKSDENGVFEFFNIPYGQYIVCELRPAEGYLPNAETYPVTVSKNDEVIEITVENDKIPKLKTTATIDGEKEVTAGETVTIDDVVSFRHLVPNKEYTLKGVLMDKKTGKPFVVDDEEITSEVTFTPETSNGEVTVSFTFDGSAVTKETDIVVFESLYSEDVEIATHTDIEDENQTVKIHPQPEPEKPQTGDNSNIGFWIGLGAVALGGLVSVVIIKIKKKDEDDE